MDNLKHSCDWSEQDIVRRIALYDEFDFLKIGGNSFCHRIIKALRRTDLLIENAGHDCLPPDYYSDDMNIMFDVMRINDSEKRKGYNPVFQEISEQKNLAKSKIAEYGLNDVHVVHSDLASDNGRNYDEIHQFRYYRKQAVRVLETHIKKLHIWRAEHPNIERRGFVVLDEAGVYFRNSMKPFVVYDDGCSTKWACYIDEFTDVHCPWYDDAFLQPLIDADLDFVVWYKPYIPLFMQTLVTFNKKITNLAVIDVRNKLRLPLQTYPVSNDWFSWQ